MSIKQQIKIANDLVEIPKYFHPVMINVVPHDNKKVVWLRFIKKESENSWGGEHFSITFDVEDIKLFGLMHLENSFETDCIPSEKEAETIAKSFLKKHAPDLLENAEMRWIRPLNKVPLSPPHDEGFEMRTGKVITGMRVKFFDKTTGKYAWVIIGKAGQIISFERDIEWDTSQKCRSTEKWLHDSWANKRTTLENNVG